MFFNKGTIFLVPILNNSCADGSMSPIQIPHLILGVQNRMNLLFRNIYDDASAVVSLFCSSSTLKPNTNEQEYRSRCAERCFTTLNVSNEEFNLRINDFFQMKQRRSDSTFTSQLFQDTSANEVLNKHVKEASLSMHADLTVN